MGCEGVSGVGWGFVGKTDIRNITLSKMREG